MPVNPTTTIRKALALPRSLWQRVEDFRFEQRIGSEAEAMRRLLELGLEAVGERKERGRLRKAQAAQQEQGR